jgi:septum formation protein
LIYLASGSPRRGELLTRIGVAYQVLMPGHGEAPVDETPQPDEAPADYALRLAKAKAEAGWLRLESASLPRHPVLAADTTVALDDLILGKPADGEEARTMLSQLSDRMHLVITAIAMIQGPVLESRLSVTRVWFRALSSRDLDEFLATGEYHDKAGGYGIQGHAARFIERVDGSPSGVMGLPLFETDQLLALFETGAP